MSEMPDKQQQQDAASGIIGMDIVKSSSDKDDNNKLKESIIDNIIPSDTSSVVSESSGVIKKPSGLKQPSASSKIAVPSKIGRLCTGQQKKPGLPITTSPTTTTATSRKYRQHFFYNCDK